METDLFLIALTCKFYNKINTIIAKNRIMSISRSCPIEYKTVDKNIIRINAFIVFSMLLLFIISSNWMFLLMIGTDFFIRVFFGLKYSPVCFLIKRVLRLSGVKPHRINAGPKTFAARIGLMFTVLISISFVLGFSTITLMISLIFLAASGMEALFDFCMACKIYPYYNKLVK